MITPSYSAASAFPFKMIKDEGLMKMLTDGEVIPFHVSLSPTNVCNRKCSFCSCEDRNKKDQLHFVDILDLFEILKDCGTKAITITGGGEPLLHPQINAIIASCPFEMGLVTNGDHLKRLNAESIDSLTWMRISCSQEYDNLLLIKEVLEDAKARNSPCDFALSYVLAYEQIDYQSLFEHVRFALENDLTHIRIVNDITIAKDIDDASDITDWVEKQLRIEGLWDERVIIQPRTESCRGMKECYVSLLRTFIGSDGYCYGCCGVQYALEDNERNTPKPMRMCHYTKLTEVIANQKYFDGSVCRVCYYGNYNKALQVLREPLQHGNFI